MSSAVLYIGLIVVIHIEYMLHLANCLPIWLTKAKGTISVYFCLNFLSKPVIMKTQLIPLCAIAALSLFSSCQKNEDDTSGKTKTELITESNWRFSKATSIGINVSGFLDECQKDNIVSFRVNGSGTLDEGATKCDSNAPQTTSFTWNFTANESAVHISTALFDGGSNDFELETLTESELEVSQNIDFGGTSQKVKVTFIH
jgi:hypothetical protein